MAEFALVLPILVLLLFGVIQLGMVFNDYLSLTDAARAGARVAAVSRHSEDPVGSATKATRAAAQDLEPSKLTVSVTSTWEHGSEVAVSASYPYSVSLLGFVVKSGTLTSATRERVE